MKQTYWGLVHKDGGSDFGISFLDFLGCVSAASTMTELMEMGSESLTLHIDGMHEDGETIPAPSPMIELPEDVDGIVAITVTVPGKKRRINLANAPTLLVELK
ncbi:type II toxin-antitoxin system HicB family antitoxin [Thalassospira xiamenensis]|uniref:type II toxin-antitoxin system HicB family antitoxin n=1 Tax=Thalassospira xiamenensis TaxID=220697 RepID=UPI003AA9C7C0